MPFGAVAFPVLSFTEVIYKDWGGLDNSKYSLNYINPAWATFFSNVGTYTHTVAITSTYQSNYKNGGLQTSFPIPAQSYTIQETLKAPDGAGGFTTHVSSRTTATDLFPWMNDTSLVPGFTLAANAVFQPIRAFGNTGYTSAHLSAISVCGVQFRSLTPQTIVSGGCTLTVQADNVFSESAAADVFNHGQPCLFEFVMMPPQSVQFNLSPRDLLNSQITPGLKVFLVLGNIYDPRQYGAFTQPDYDDALTSQFIVPATTPLNQTVSVPTRAVAQGWTVFTQSGSQVLQIDSGQRTMQIVASKENYNGFLFPPQATLWTRLEQSLGGPLAGGTPYGAYGNSNILFRLHPDAGATRVPLSGTAAFVQTVPLTITGVSHTGGTVTNSGGVFTCTAGTGPPAYFQVNLSDAAGKPTIPASPFRYLRFDATVAVGFTLSLQIDDQPVSSSYVGSSKLYNITLAVGTHTYWVDLMNPDAVNGGVRSTLPTIEDEILYDNPGSVGRFNGIRRISEMNFRISSASVGLSKVALDTLDKNSSQILGVTAGGAGTGGGVGAIYRIHSDGKNAVEMTGDPLQFGLAVPNNGFPPPLAVGMQPNTLSISIPAQSPLFVTFNRALNSWQCNGYVDPFDTSGNVIQERIAIIVDNLGVTYSPGSILQISAIASSLSLPGNLWWGNPVVATAVWLWSSLFAQTVVPDSISPSTVRLGTGAPPDFSLAIADTSNTHHGYALGFTTFGFANTIPNYPTLIQYMAPANPLTIPLWKVDGSSLSFFLWHHTRMSPASPPGSGLHLTKDRSGYIYAASATAAGVVVQKFNFDGVDKVFTVTTVPAKSAQICFLPSGRLIVVYDDASGNVWRTYSDSRAVHWSDPVNLWAGNVPAIAVDRGGREYVAYWTSNSWWVRVTRDPDFLSFDGAYKIVDGDSTPTRAGLEIHPVSDAKLVFMVEIGGHIRRFVSVSGGKVWEET